MPNVEDRAKYPCPVCAFAMSYPANSFNICPSCGTEFELDDFERTPQELRMAWINAGLPWFSKSTPAPKDWNPYRQLIAAGYGTDLVASPRFETEIGYQYAVDEAFSSIQMARQIRSSREAQTPPITQVELAEKADMKQSRISELESIDYSAWSVNTLRRLARALGVRFVFRFEPLATLGPEIHALNQHVDLAEEGRQAAHREELRAIMTEILESSSKRFSLNSIPAGVTWTGLSTAVIANTVFYPQIQPPWVIVPANQGGAQAAVTVTAAEGFWSAPTGLAEAEEAA